MTTAQPDWLTRRELGIARSVRRCPDEWTESAAKYLRAYGEIITFGQPFLLEDARDASHGMVTQPPNLKAWGAATVYAVRRGWIVKAGYGPARSSNGSPKCLWRVP